MYKGCITKLKCIIHIVIFNGTEISSKSLVNSLFYSYWEKTDYFHIIYWLFPIKTLYNFELSIWLPKDSKHMFPFMFQVVSWSFIYLDSIFVVFSVKIVYLIIEFLKNYNLNSRWKKFNFYQISILKLF